MTEFLETMIVGATLIILFAIVFGFVLTMRYLKYKERKVIAEVNGRIAQKEPKDE